MFEPIDWSFPTTVWFGPGRAEELPQACALLAIRRPLLVTDQGLAELELVADLLARLEAGSESTTLFAQVQGNPTLANVLAGVKAFNEGEHDGIVAVGGGSALDVGKSIALIARQSRPLWDFVDTDAPVSELTSETLVPLIALPTTAGTGSEVGRAAVILDEETASKNIVFHPSMLPNIVISDPLLTLGLPPTITAWTGIDAFVHALEAYGSPNFHPMAQGIAIEAMRMIHRWLPVAVAEGSNVEARGHMLVAASMGATAFQKGLGSIHSVSHVVGALYDTHHGLTNAVVLPFGVIQNMSAIAERLGHLSRVLELPGHGAGALVDFLFEFRAQLDIPGNLAELGIDEERAVEIGRLAELDRCTATNAMPVTAKDLERLFRAAVSGDQSRL